MRTSTSLLLSACVSEHQGHGSSGCDALIGLGVPGRLTGGTSTGGNLPSSGGPENRLLVGLFLPLRKKKKKKMENKSQF